MDNPSPKDMSEAINCEEVLRIASEVAIAAGDMNAMSPAELAEEPAIVAMLVSMASYWRRKGRDSLSADLARATATIQSVADNIGGSPGNIVEWSAEVGAAMLRGDALIQSLNTELARATAQGMERAAVICEQRQIDRDKQAESDYGRSKGYGVPDWREDLVERNREDEDCAEAIREEIARLAPTPLPETAKENEV